MGGYAWTALFLVLHKQLNAEVDTLLKGAAGFLIVSAWLIHFEPFTGRLQLALLQVLAQVRVVVGPSVGVRR
jgi:hypothetical protein